MLSTLPEDVVQDDFEADDTESQSRDRNTWRRANGMQQRYISARRPNPPHARQIDSQAGPPNLTKSLLVDAAALDGFEAIAQAGFEVFGNGPLPHRSSVPAMPVAQAEREGATSAAADAHRRRRKDDRPEGAQVIQRVVLGSVVTFGAGLAILGLTTGFESCAIRINGLPSDALDREIYALFTQQGIEEARLYLMYNKTLPDGTREAKVVMDAETGQVLSVGLDDLDFRGSRLSFEVGRFNIPGRMGVSTVKDTNMLTVSCPAASIRYVVTYASEELARDKCSELDGFEHLGRRLKAEYSRASTGSTIESNGDYDAPHYAMKISNLPRSTTFDDVRSLAGPEALVLRPLALKGALSNDVALDTLNEMVRSSGCQRSEILSFETPDIADLRNGTLTVRVAFSSWDAAKKVHDHMQGIKLAALGNKTFQVFLPSPLSYSITIPTRQHDAQSTQWNEMRRESHAGDKTLGCLTRLQVPGKSLVRLRVTGSDKKSVGALKLRVESLAAGEKVVGWHSRLLRADNPFADRVFNETGAYLRVDRHQRQIKVFGSADAVTRARTLVQDELTRLSGLDFRTQVPPSCVRAFLAQGLQELHELLGEENVHYDASKRILTTSGDDDTRHIVSRVIKRAARNSTMIGHAGGDVCPICFDVVRAPLLLPCSHTYCSSCLRHFVTSAEDLDTFPLVCMGNEAQCNAPIPLPVIERFLPLPALARLLEAAFSAYVSQHAQTIRFCRTPDCEQIYRATSVIGPAPSPVQCPACLAVVCPGCHEDEHEGLTCEESLLRSDPTRLDTLVDEWIAAQNGHVKRCPQCRIPIEKTEGCNHMECRCGAHVCWTCLGIFSAREIYAHMRDVHGGIHDIAADVHPYAAFLPDFAPVENDFLNRNDAPFFQAQYRPLGLNADGAGDVRRQGVLWDRRVDEVDAENMRLRERFLAAETERQRRQEMGAAQQDRRYLAWMQVLRRRT